MVQTLCQECARKKGLLPEVVSAGAGYTGTDYQLDKYIKHTAPKRFYPYVSVFKDPSTAMYSTYIVSALADGYVEVDDRDRVNVNYFASATAGYAISMGHAKGPVSGVKVVLADDPERIHAFPVDLGDIEVVRCNVCGKEILHDKSRA